jgi:hypothetical protein
LQTEVSGSLLSQPLHFRLVDTYGKEAKLVVNRFTRGFAFAELYEGQRSSSKLTKIKSSNISRSALIGDLQVPIVRGEINFDYLKVVGDPDSFISIKIDLDLDYNEKFLPLDSLNENEIVSGKKYYFIVDIYLRKCKRGEVVNVFANTCDTCPQDTFSLKVPGAKCEHCPDRGVCHGGDVIELSSKFY